MPKTPLTKLNLSWPGSEKFTAYVKDESKNPFGTIKDRRNEPIIKEAQRYFVDKLALITSGNNGHSLAQLAKGTDIKVVCVIGEDASVSMKNALEKVAFKIIPVNLSYKIFQTEDLITFTREKDDEVIWDVTNGYEDNYQIVLREIFEKIIPDYVIVPVGSGGMYISFVNMIERTGIKTRVVGISVEMTRQSFADKLCTPWTPHEKMMQAYQRLGHPIYKLSEAEVRKTYYKFKKIVNCEPSASVVFAAPNKHFFKKTDTVVFINSGKGVLC